MKVDVEKVSVLVSIESDDRVGREILGQLPGVEVLPYDPAPARLNDMQRNAQILIPPYRGSHRPIPLVDQLPSLRMVQLLSAGVDEWAGHVPAGIVLASARGAHAGPVSEWIASAILTQFRQWPTLLQFQNEGTWAHRQFEADTLDGKRALIVGAGAIGTATARRLSVFGVEPTLVASAAREGVHGPEDLPRLARGHQIVVITVPLTNQTQRLINADFLASMDDSALLVNAARGQIVDTNALVSELETGRLRAALDVTDPEPLPSNHPLWRCKGVIISPHSARTVPGTNRLCYSVATEQISTFIAGKVPSNAASQVGVS
ncbi:NAD(P)-dependent oxidoreductase [Actinosynnema sp. NPDC023587]|uniref:NAD(P)-dependent oxidoreductase n=1 Tax=Actinosynnema sp. NPDC023587 TaxID=3154695 RepID=UPI0033FD6031